MPSPARDFHDPRNDQRVTIAIERVSMVAEDLAERLHDLAGVLEPDVELTPAQARRIARALADAGRAGAVLLMTDLERTAKREGANLGPWLDA